MLFAFPVVFWAEAPWQTQEKAYITSTVGFDSAVALLYMHLVQEQWYLVGCLCWFLGVAEINPSNSKIVMVPIWRILPQNLPENFQLQCLWDRSAMRCFLGFWLLWFLFHSIGGSRCEFNMSMGLWWRLQISVFVWWVRSSGESGRSRWWHGRQHLGPGWEKWCCCGTSI